MPEKTLKKITEVFPAALVWLTFIVIITLSFARPLWAIYFILVFVVYWIVRLFYMMVWLIISWIKYLKDTKTNWLEEIKTLPKDYREYYQVIKSPIGGEPLEVGERSFNELLKTNYPKDRMIVVLGGEARKGEQFQEVARKITEKFGRQFFKLLITT